MSVPTSQLTLLRESYPLPTRHTDCMASLFYFRTSVSIICCKHMSVVRGSVEASCTVIEVRYLLKKLHNFSYERNAQSLEVSYLK